LSEEDQASFAQVKAMLNGMKMSMNMKQSANADNTVLKAQAAVNMFMAGMSLDMGVWVDMDMNGAAPKFKEIVKLPALFTASDPTLAGKEYMVIDLGKMMSAPGTIEQAQSANYAETMKLTKEMQAKALTFWGKYMQQYNPGFKFITDAGMKDIVTPERTVKAHAYQLKLDDKAAKKLIRYTVNNIADSKDAMQFAADYMKLIGKYSVPAPGAVNPAADFDKMLADFEKEKPAMLAEFNKFMDDIENVQIFGEKGITIEYAIDENGYLIKQSGTIDFVFDVAKLSTIGKLADTADPGAGVYNVGLDFSMLTYNINKDMQIQMPAVTPENSVEYDNMLNSKLPTQ
jgi:hypothetical protein